MANNQLYTHALDENDHVVLVPITQEQTADGRAATASEYQKMMAKMQGQEQQTTTQTLGRRPTFTQKDAYDLRVLWQTRDNLIHVMLNGSANAANYGDKLQAVNDAIRTLENKRNLANEH